MADSPVHIVLAGLLAGGISGFAMHRSDFCFAGAFRDLFLFGKGRMLRVLVLVVAVSMLLFDAARHLGLLPFYPFPLLGAISPANFAGGALFGAGMVLAGGCVIGTLYRAGSGSVTAITAIVGLVAGSAIYAELHPAWSALVRSLPLFPGKATLPQIAGIDPTWFVAAALIPAAVAIGGWVRDGALVRTSAAEGDLQPWATGIVLSFMGLLSWAVAGMPMGITTSYAKAAAALESWIAPGHQAGVAFFRATPLDIRYPSGLVLKGGPGPEIDGIATIQFPLIAGIVAGSFLSALLLREFRFRSGIPPVQILSALAGGILMGLSARMAPGCNVWHVLGGLPVFSVPSILFVLGLFPGAWIGSRAISRII